MQLHSYVHNNYNFQISMSVVLILVTPMPCVLTPAVPTHVPAMLDSQEMESLAQVIIVINFVHDSKEPIGFYSDSDARTASATCAMGFKTY